MGFREYIKKYQGKCYRYECDMMVMYMRVVKTGTRKDAIYPYFVIYEFVTYSTKDKDWEMYTENTEHRDLIPPNLYGWKRITKSDFDTAKRKCMRSQPKYVAKK